VHFLRRYKRRSKKPPNSDKTSPQPRQECPRQGGGCRLSRHFSFLETVKKRNEPRRKDSPSWGCPDEWRERKRERPSELQGGHSKRKWRCRHLNARHGGNKGQTYAGGIQGRRGGNFLGSERETSEPNRVFTGHASRS